LQINFNNTNSFISDLVVMNNYAELALTPIKIPTKDHSRTLDRRLLDTEQPSTYESRLSANGPAV
jgi:hypothetical protein